MKAGEERRSGNDSVHMLCYTRENVNIVEALRGSHVHCTAHRGGLTWRTHEHYHSLAEPCLLALLPLPPGDAATNDPHTAL